MYVTVFAVCNLRTFTSVFQSNYLSELNSLFAKVDDRRRVSIVTKSVGVVLDHRIFLEARGARLFMWENQF